MKNFVSNVKTAALKVRNNYAMKLAGVKTEDGDHLVEVLGTIVIAVAILLLFQGQLKNMFNQLTNRTVEEVNNLFPG